MTTLIQLLETTSWRQLRSRSTPVAIETLGSAWIDQPSQAFIDYVTNRLPLPFDGVPPKPAVYLKDPTYVICQAHRLWVTLGMLKKHCRLSEESSVVDLGAFPFSLPVILREFEHFSGPITATSNLPLASELQVSLADRAIQLEYLELDAYVNSDSDFERNLPGQLPFANDTVDLIVFSHVIEHLYHPMRILREAQRLLKPGGHLLISTDNSQMLDAFVNIGSQNDYNYEPIEGTSAMSFNFWRGHNRMFSGGDLRRLCTGAGLRPVETAYREVFYEAFVEGYFRTSPLTIPEWRARVLEECPGHRNEVLVVAQKPKSRHLAVTADLLAQSLLPDTARVTLGGNAEWKDTPGMPQARSILLNGPGAFVECRVPGKRAILSFWGHQWSGMIRIELNGEFLFTENAYADTPGPDAIEVALPGLVRDGDLLRVTVDESKDPAAKGMEIWLMALTTDGLRQA